MKNEASEVFEALPDKADMKAGQYKARFEKAELQTFGDIHSVKLHYRDVSRNEPYSRIWSTTEVSGWYEMGGDEMCTNLRRSRVLNSLNAIRDKLNPGDFQRILEHLRLTEETRDATRRTLK